MTAEQRTCKHLVLTRYWPHGKMWAKECKYCGLYGPEAATEEEALRLWEKRIREEREI